MADQNRYELNKNLAQMLKGGVIMDVTTPEQAKIAEAAGAAAAHERPQDDQGHSGCSLYPGHGQMPYWPLCRSADFAGYRD